MHTYQRVAAGASSDHLDPDVSSHGVAEVVAGASSDQLVSLNATQTLTGKSISGSDNTFSNIPYSVITSAPPIPTNNNQLTNGENYITLASAGNLTNKFK